jgi:hypothetical protein
MRQFLSLLIAFALFTTSAGELFAPHSAAAMTHGADSMDHHAPISEMGAAHDAACMTALSHCGSAMPPAPVSSMDDLAFAVVILPTQYKSLTVGLCPECETPPPRS